MKKAFFDVFNNLGENVKLENLKKYYQFLKDKVSIKVEESKEAIQVRYSQYKEWIETSYFKEVYHFPGKVFNKIDDLSRPSRVFLYERVYTPTKNFTFLVTSSSYSLVVRNVENVKETSSKMYNHIKDYFNDKYKNFKEEVFDKYIKIEENEENKTVRIEISKKMFVIYPTKFYDFMKKYNWVYH